MDDDAFGNLDYDYDNIDELAENTNEEFDHNIDIKCPDGSITRMEKKKFSNKRKKNQFKKQYKSSELSSDQVPLSFYCVKKRPEEIFVELENKQEPEQLFNTVSALDWHLKIGDEELTAKRRRIELDNAVSQTSLRILAARKARSQPKTTISQIKQIVHENDCRIGHKQSELLQMPPMDGRAWYGISSPDGNIRGYLSISKRKQSQRSEHIPTNFETNTLEFTKSHDNELDIFNRLMDQIEEQQRRKLQIEMLERRELVESNTSLSRCNIANKVQHLWFDKYSPHNFLDLLTDNETNRLVLLWLRLWENYVFRNKRLNFWDRLDDKDKILMEIEQQKGGHFLPKHKILVLYGTSGVGKTSLAHIAAKQAGYQPLTLSISEFQNMNELRIRLENATNSTNIDKIFQKQHKASDTELSISFSNKQEQNLYGKPVCIIIEGLELAAAEMIQFVCNWAYRSGRGIIRRPLICICTSIWQGPLNAMKELRANAMTLKVPPSNHERLKRRLIKICGYENIQIDANLINDLILSHGTDIRLCLNTLQLLTANAKKRPIKESFHQIHSKPREFTNTAMSVSMFDVLNAIFTLDFHEENRIIRPLKDRAYTLVNLLGQLPSDDFNRLQQLVFANYSTVLRLSYDQCRRVADLFVLMDQYRQMIQLGQHFTLNRYFPYMLIAIHYICALYVSRRLSFNMIAQPLLERFRESQQIQRLSRVEALIGQHCLGNKRNMSNEHSHAHLDLHLPSIISTNKITGTSSKNLFTLRHSIGNSQLVRRRLRIGELF